MNIDLEVLIEAYSTLKQYIPPKDRQEATDALTSILVDLLGDDELKEFSMVDRYTKASFKEYNNDYDETIDNDSDEDNY